MQKITKDNITLIHSDCLEELQKLPSECVDICMTSPPYNIGLKYNDYQDNLDFADYLDWFTIIASEIRRVLKPLGSFFLNVGSTNAEPFIAMDVAQKVRELFVLQNNIIWVKSIVVNGDSFGHFKPINSNRFLNHIYENIFHFTKGGNVVLDRLAVGVPYKDKSNISRWKHDGAPRDRRCAGDVWFIPYKTVQSKGEKFNHPAGYPEELVERCIALHGMEQPVVLDPFLGAGTTLVVCKKLGCSGIGIELDKVYFDTCLLRLGLQTD